MRNRRLWLAALLCATAMPVEARITADAGGKVFRLEGGNVTYAIGVDDKGYLQTLYWGSRIPDADKLPVAAVPDRSGFDLGPQLTAQEFPGQGGGLVTEPGVKAAFPDGNRDLVLKYVSHQISGERLVVELADISRPFKVTLTYQIDPVTGIVGRSAAVRNAGRKPVRIDQLASAVFTIPAAPDYRLHYMTGRHAAEWTMQEQPVTPALTVLESRRGSTSNQNNPWFAIDQKGVSSEEAGPVWFGTLAWSGSWRISIGADIMGKVKISGGFNPYDFAWSLKAGETLESPVFYAGYSDDGMGGASRLLHGFERSSILPQRPTPKLRPVLYNSWEATEFAVDDAGQTALAERAAKIGVERFVMDDGWFGARNNDRAGLGDWTVNRKKFPDGLKPLIDKVHGLGMEFGLWVEPEMVNADSDLYRKHPDWAMHFEGRPRSEGRNQLVLNLARKDVRDYLLKELDDLLKENDIQFLKWDYNRNWTEPGWPGQKPEDQQRIYVDYVRNLYYIFAELRRRHPKLEIETCSGGGARVDLGILGLTDQAWTSDNTDPFDRLAIQDGFTHAFTPGVMMAWVTDTPNWVNGRTTTLDYRFLSSMQGGLGIGSNLNKWQDADFATATRWIAAYKGIRKTVQEGDLYRLIRPLPGTERSATFYVAPDKVQAVLFVMLHSSTKREPQPLIKLHGLDPAKTYRVRMLDGSAVPTSLAASRSGQWLMNHGVDLPLKGDFVGAGLVYEAQ